LYENKTIVIERERQGGSAFICSSTNYFYILI